MPPPLESLEAPKTPINKSKPLVATDFSEADQKRFWSRVNKNGPLPDQLNPHYANLDCCWEWTAGKFQRGYGAIPLLNKTFKAHRISYCFHHGEVPNDLFVCHHCDNPSCVRPSHLFLGDINANGFDMSIKGRATRTGPTNPVKGERHHKAKLNSEKVKAIREEYSLGGTSHKKLGLKYGVRDTSIRMILIGKHWKTL